MSLFGTHNSLSFLLEHLFKKKGINNIIVPDEALHFCGQKGYNHCFFWLKLLLLITAMGSSTECFVAIVFKFEILNLPFHLAIAIRDF